MIKKAICLSLTLFMLLSLPILAVDVGDTVSVGGMPFGIKLYTRGVLVSGVSEVDCEDGNISPGNESGLLAGDIILELDGIELDSAKDVLDIVSDCKGENLSLKVLRGKDSLDMDITPVKSKSEDRYMLGLWIKDGTAGIGTVTWFSEKNGEFAGLGHGVCDSHSGELLKLKVGEVFDVAINGITKGQKDSPGQLLGFFCQDVIGNLTANTHRGVCGIYNSILPCSSEKAIIGAREDVCEGEAYILCTLDDNIISRFDINIEKINHFDSDTKNFIVKVTDPALLERTGGIVQGMSGSPIIQDGKLVGAVTHVLVDDPARGYGIFIENMLEAAG